MMASVNRALECRLRGFDGDEPDLLGRIARPASRLHPPGPVAGQMESRDLIIDVFSADFGSDRITLNGASGRDDTLVVEEFGSFPDSIRVRGFENIVDEIEV